MDLNPKSQTALGWDISFHDSWFNIALCLFVFSVHLLNFLSTLNSVPKICAWFHLISENVNTKIDTKEFIKIWVRKTNGTFTLNTIDSECASPLVWRIWSGHHRRYFLLLPCAYQQRIYCIIYIVVVIIVISRCQRMCLRTICSVACVLVVVLCIIVYSPAHRYRYYIYSLPSHEFEWNHRVDASSVEYAECECVCEFCHNMDFKSTNDR